MRAVDVDPVARWQAVSAWYREFVSANGWVFLLPMAELAEWISKQSFAAPLFPSTSHQWLCVALHPDFDPDAAKFFCCTRPDGQFEFSQRNLAVYDQGKQFCAPGDARETFQKFASILTRSA